MVKSERFEKFINVILQNEGKKTIDTGGKTSYGISEFAHKGLDIDELTKETAINIYFDEYYTPNKIENIIYEELALQVFDFGVNAGVSTAAKILQKCLGVVKDGKIGKNTLEAISHYNEKVITELYKEKRAEHYLYLYFEDPNKYETYIKGWIYRIFRTYII